MTPLWTAGDVALATGGDAQGDFAVDSVTFDSREVIGGELFVALRGETTDGHRFIDMARERGAAGFLVETPVTGPHVRVPDTMAGLEALAAASRARAAEATIVGVTGSVGKTGVKEALRASFERFAPERTHASVKSYNNHTGVPLSLARMHADTRFGVFEMGMNHAGELARLTAQVRPHIAIVTWVASAHREFFATEEAIADAKGEIFAGLEPGGTAVIAYDNPHRDRLIAAARPFAADIVTFGTGEGADVRAARFDLRPDRTEMVARLGDETLHFDIGMAGRHWVNNALGVLAVVRAAGADLAMAALALAQLTDLPGRGKRSRVAARGGEAVLIDESYNANPASMAAALAVLGGVAPEGAGRRIAVLGAMRELGRESDAFHAGLAPLVEGAGVARTILVGPEMTALAAALGRGAGTIHVDNAQEALAALRAELAGGDVLLVKGSNSVGLGTLVAGLAAGGSA